MEWPFVSRKKYDAMARMNLFLAKEIAMYDGMVKNLRDDFTIAQVDLDDLKGVIDERINRKGLDLDVD